MTTTGAPPLQIRVLDPQHEAPETYTALARLFADAYPIMRLTTAEALAEGADKLRSRSEPGTADVVAERGGALAGAMRLFDYTMNVHGRDALAGGVGAVAVALTHKRQGIARELISWYLDHYRRRGAPFAILHPFRLDFYRAMGFGYGTPVHRFRFEPATLRDAGARGTARFLGPDDRDALCACDERVRSVTHGMTVRHRAPLERALADPAQRFVGVEEDGVLRGFMQTVVVNAPDDRLRNHDELLARDLTYEDATYLAALLGYLRAQRDQFARIVVETQDEAFYLAAGDPRDGSDVSVAPPAGHRVAETGLGMMFRILDVPTAFAHLPPAGRPLTLKVVAADTFAPAVAGTWTFRFGPGGAAHLAEPPAQPDATLTIGIADLASVVMGTLRLDDVVRHGLASVEPRPLLAELDAVFRAAHPPRCTARF